MPTGYTSDIHDGKEVTFEQFAMNCARAFGALIMMRDDPLDTPIPEKLKPYTRYHNKELARAKKDIALLNKTSNDELENIRRNEYLRSVEEWKKESDKNKKMRTRYLKMLAKVEKWNPPTSEHVGLKVFMKKQLQKSIDFDCYSRERPKPPETSIESYRDDELTKLNRDIAYHETEKQKEIERTKGRNDWIKQLRESLENNKYLL